MAITRDRRGWLAGTRRRANHGGSRVFSGPLLARIPLQAATDHPTAGKLSLKNTGRGGRVDSTPTAKCSAYASRPIRRTETGGGRSPPSSVDRQERERGHREEKSEGEAEGKRRERGGGRRQEKRFGRRSEASSLQYHPPETRWFSGPRAFEGVPLGLKEKVRGRIKNS